MVLPPRSCPRGGNIVSQGQGIKDLDLNPQPPTNTRSPTPNSDKPPILTEPYGEPTFGVLLRGR